MLHTIREMQLLTSEEKTYAGIQAIEHLCRIKLGGRIETVKLVSSGCFKAAGSI